MRKLFLVLLFGMFVLSNLAKSETYLEFQNRCMGKPNSSVNYVPIGIEPCTGFITVCKSKIGNTIYIEYYSILATSFPCNIISYSNLMDINFWRSIDEAVINWSESSGGGILVPCGSTNVKTFYMISKRPCQKIINNGNASSQDPNVPLVYQTLVPCGGLENNCTLKYSVCTEKVDGVDIIRKTPIETTMTGTTNCTTTIPNTTQQFVWNSEGQYFDILFDPTANWETECFSMGCN
jgi:hypothetical protein